MHCRIAERGSRSSEEWRSSPLADPGGRRAGRWRAAGVVSLPPRLRGLRAAAPALAAAARRGAAGGVRGLRHLPGWWEALPGELAACLDIRLRPVPRALFAAGPLMLLWLLAELRRHPGDSAEDGAGVVLRGVQARRVTMSAVRRKLVGLLA
eukprot:scaffold3111_cov332-Prasinococcus_capsulatus_cf.AAC.16